MSEGNAIAAAIQAPLAPASAARAWRDRLFQAIDAHPDLAPDQILSALAAKLPDDPIAVFRAITAILPKEVDVTTSGQVNHLTLLRIVGAAQDRGVDLAAIADASPEAPLPASTEELSFLA